MAKRDLLVDTGLGAWALFLPAIMTLGGLGEGFYGRSLASGLLCLVIVAASVTLLRSGSTRSRLMLVALSGVWPFCITVYYLPRTTSAFFAAWTLVAVGVSLLLRKMGERSVGPPTRLRSGNRISYLMLRSRGITPLIESPRDGQAVCQRTL